MIDVILEPLKQIYGVCWQTRVHTLGWKQIHLSKEIFEGKNSQNLVRRSWSRPILLYISMKADVTPSINESDCCNSWIYNNKYCYRKIWKVESALLLKKTLKIRLTTGYILWKHCKEEYHWMRILILYKVGIYYEGCLIWRIVHSKDGKVEVHIKSDNWINYRNAYWMYPQMVLFFSPGYCTSA